MENKDCPNGYTPEDFYKEFCATESETKICNKCPYFQYEDGTMVCTKFNK